MFMVGLLISILSAFTGISAQVAMAPSLVFLLGFSQEKSTGTALSYALLTACGAVIGASLNGLNPPLLTGIILTVGATLGAVFTAMKANAPSMKRSQQIAQSLAMILAIYVLGEAVRRPLGGPAAMQIEFLRTSLGLFLVGVVCGALSSLFRVANGILMVPAMIYLGNLHVSAAILTSSVVTALAAVLPTLSMNARQYVDRRTGAWLMAGGLLGGMLGGLLLSALSPFSQATPSPLPFAVFGLCAMFLCAWMLAKLSQESPPAKV
jgi:uncharacterized membrane protein YfcA